MNEAEAVDTIRHFIEKKKFPKSCANCGRVFNSLLSYVRNTTPIGAPVSYDADSRDWRPLAPIGTLAYSMCICGTTLTIDSKGLSRVTLWRLMHWARSETKRRGIPLTDLLIDLRLKIERDVLTSATETVLHPPA